MADLVDNLQLSLKNVCTFRYFFVTLAFLKAEGRLHPGNENKSRFILHFARFALPLQAESTATACRWCLIQTREESPGSTGRPTSESGSYW